MNGSCRVLTACLIGIVAGCASAPIRYYTLTPPAGDGSTAPVNRLAIDVRVVHTPAQLNRTELVVRTGPAEVALLDNERWASPVKDEIKDALRLELQRRLGAAIDVQPANSKLTITVDVQHFEAELGRHALIEGSWTLVLAHGPGSDEGRAATCSFRADVKIAAGYAAMVNGYQRGIAALADAIVAELRARAGGTDASCGQAVRS